MSWRTINAILGLAMIDAEFARRLLDHPLSTIQEYGFDITEAEKDLLRHARASDISELSKILVERFSGNEGSD